MMNSTVVVYSRAGCHLCDDAVALLRENGLQPEVIDIDGDPNLHSRYDTCVPVVVIDGRERFRGLVNPVLLRRLLRNRQA
jgi:glutaredoxin